MASQAERALATVVLLMLEHGQCGEGAAEMQALLKSADIAGPTLAVAEDVVLSQTAFDVLLALRLVQAVLKADLAHGALIGRYYIMSAMQDMAQENILKVLCIVIFCSKYTGALTFENAWQEKGILYETLALQAHILKRTFGSDFA